LAFFLWCEQHGVSPPFRVNFPRNLPGAILIIKLQVKKASTNQGQAYKTVNCA
jgi:hypothetical protein